MSNIGIPDRFEITDFNWRSSSLIGPSAAEKLFGLIEDVETDRPQVLGSSKSKTKIKKVKTHDTEQKRRIRASKKNRDVKIDTVEFGGCNVRVPRRQHRRNGRKMIVIEFKDMDPERQSLYLDLQTFYSASKYVEKLVYQFGEELHEVALRLINTAVTTYAPKHATRYRIDNSGKIHDINATSLPFDPTTNSVVDLATEYETELRDWKKKLFDPCRRHERISWPLIDGTRWITTLGQLNFFRWAIKIRLVDWCIIHKEDLTRFLKVQDGEKGKILNNVKVRKRRRESHSTNNYAFVFSKPFHVKVWNGRNSDNK
jgi:hypothetical protein